MFLLVTATMNEKQLRGMLHYHPISSAGGGELVVFLHLAESCVCSRRGGVGGLSGIGLQTRNWVEQPPLQLTRPCTSSFVSVMRPFLSAINLRLHLPIFIPFALVSPSPPVLQALAGFTLVRHHCCTPVTNNGSPGTLTAAFYKA